MGYSYGQTLVSDDGRGLNQTFASAFENRMKVNASDLEQLKSASSFKIKVDLNNETFTINHLYNSDIILVNEKKYSYNSLIEYNKILIGFTRSIIVLSGIIRNIY